MGASFLTNNRVAFASTSGYGEMAGKETLLEKLEKFLRQEVSQEGQSTKPEVPSSESESELESSGEQVEAVKDSAAGGNLSTPVSYSASDYLAKGKPSSEAAKSFHHILKVASCEAKVWGSGLASKQITPAQRKYIHDRVIDECPALKGHSRDIDLALGRGLANSNYYQREKKKKAKVNKGKEKAESEVDRIEKRSKSKKRKGSTKVDKKMSHHEDTGGPVCSANEKIIEGDKVIIFNDDKDLAEGLFIKEISPGMYSQVKFVKIFNASDDIIDLPEKAGEKTHLGQLKRNDIFKWKSAKLKKTEMKRARKRNTMFDSDYLS